MGEKLLAVPPGRELVDLSFYTFNLLNLPILKHIALRVVRAEK
jgi:hypothetical protein